MKEKIGKSHKQTIHRKADANSPKKSKKFSIFFEFREILK